MRDALGAEPALADALIEPAPAPLLAPLVAPPLRPIEAAGLDLILEGFLLHHGVSRHVAIADRGRRVLAGDYCYATGLVRVAAAGDLFVIEALSELIAVSAGLVARRGRDQLEPLWRGTVAAIALGGGGNGDGPAAALAAATTSLEASGDGGPLRALADRLGPTPGLAEALAR